MLNRVSAWSTWGLSALARCTFRNNLSTKLDPRISRILSVFTVVMVLWIPGSSLFAQSVPIGPGGYTQDFNSLSDTAASWTNDVTIPGWYAFQQVGTLTGYAGNDGTSTTGGLYSYGSSLSSERSLGALAQIGSAGHIVFGLSLQNTSGNTLPIALDYLGKQWRANSATVQSLTFSYQVTPAALTSSSEWDATTALPLGWLPLSSLDFNSPTNTLAGAIDGNLAANQAVLGSTFLTDVANGDFIQLRWFANAESDTANHGLAIDSLGIVAVPEPTTLALVGLSLGCAGYYGFQRRRRLKLAMEEDIH